jgi:hypothetical protein
MLNATATAMRMIDATTGLSALEFLNLIFCFVLTVDLEWRGTDES